MMPGTSDRSTILIADDTFANRALLEKIFSSEYDVLLAKNGREVLDQLKVHDDVACVLLDIMMPELDGFGVLAKMQDNERLAGIPVVVITSSEDEADQIHALDLGAADLVSKPFNTQVLLRRVRNTIARAELVRVSEKNRLYEARLAQQARRIKATRIDGKTGLLNASGFYESTTELVRAHPDVHFCIVRWDIDRFKVYNDVFGTHEGDRLLRTMGLIVSRRYDEELCVAGRLEADNFAFCLPSEDFDAKPFINLVTKSLASHQATFSFSPRAGIYMVDDVDIDAELMCDRALLALRSVKSDYSHRYAVYDDSMRAGLIHEQEVVSEMAGALDRGEFLVYLQPQYDYVRGEMSGAEALVRWKHPKKGIVPPNDFIPIFERNGFITHLDKYMWEQTCMLLARWRTEGRPDLPISVNISRYDCYDEHLVDTICDLTDKYGIPRDLLHLEITESAYMDDPGHLVSIVNEFHDRGFSMEMDDFGSGFSSLNMLKDVRVSCLKLDRGFVMESHTSSRGGSILGSVVRMAHWLKARVLAEGVETKEQAEFLKSIGCTLMQGFLFSKPVPVADFEKLPRTLPDIDRTTAIDTSIDIKGAADFLDASTQSTLLFNSFVGGAAIVEDDGDNLEVPRTNDRFYETLGTTADEFAGHALHLFGAVEPESRATLRDALEATRASGDQAACKIKVMPLRTGGDPVWLRVWVRYLSHNMNQHIYYLSIDNITEQTVLLEKNTKLSQDLTFVMSTLPGGIAYFDHDGTTTSETFFSVSTAGMFGFTTDEYRERFSDDITQAFHPDDQEAFSTYIEEVLKDPEHLHTVRCRHMLKGGGWQWLQITGRATHTGQGATEVANIYLDIDQQVANEQALKKQTDKLERQGTFLEHMFDSVPCGIIELLPNEDGAFDLIMCNQAAWKMGGWPDADWLRRHLAMPESLTEIMGKDAHLFRESVEQAYHEDSVVAFDQRMIRADGSMGWVHNQMQSATSLDGHHVVQCVFTDITSTRHDTIAKPDASLNGLQELIEYNWVTDTAVALRSDSSGLADMGEPFALGRNAGAWIERYVHPDDAEQLGQVIAGVVDGSIEDARCLTFRTILPEGGIKTYISTIMRMKPDLFLLCASDAASLADAPRIEASRPPIETPSRSLAERLLLLFARSATAEDMLAHALEAVGQELGLTRAWIVDAVPATMHISSIHEWVDPTADPTPQSVSAAGAVENFPQQLSSLADQGARIVCDDASHDRHGESNTNTMHGEQAYVLYPQHTGQETSGCIGFDCRSARDWTADDLSRLDFAALVLELVLVHEHMEHSRQELDEDYLATLDRSTDLFYVVEPQSHRLLYANTALRQRHGVFVGDICYQALFGRTTPCEVCPMDDLTKFGTTVPLAVQSDASPTGPLLVQACPVVLDHQEGTLLCATEMGSGVASTDLGQSSYERKFRDFSRTVFSIYDSVSEMDYAKGTSTVVAAKQNPSSIGTSYDLVNAVKTWMGASPDEKTAKLLERFTTRPKSSSQPVSVDYPVHYAGRDEWFRTTSFQIDEDRWLACSRNITEEVKARRALADNNRLTLESEDREKYRIVVEQTGAAVIEWNHATGSFSASAAYSRYAISQVDPDVVFASRTGASYIHPDDAPAYARFVDDIKAGDQRPSTLLRLRMTDGTFRWTTIERTQIMGEDGSPARTVVTLIDVDEKTKAGLALENTNGRLEDIVSNVPLGVAVYEITDKPHPLFMNDVGIEMLGYTHVDHDDAVAKGDARFFMGTLTESIGPLTPEEYDHACHRILAKRKDGSPIWLDVYTSIVPDGDRTLCYAALVDATEEVEAKQRERWLFERYRLLSESSDLVTLDLDVPSDHLVVNYMQPGKTPIEENIDDFSESTLNSSDGCWVTRTVHPNSLALFTRMLSRSLVTPGTLSFNFQADYHRSGWRWYRMKSISVADEGGAVTRVVARAEDVSNEFEEQEALRHIAETDGLTGLLNKQTGLQLMRRSLQRRRPTRVDAVLMIDIDNFKTINDSVGHLFGDKALKMVAACIKSSFRSGDIVARFGGDEFVVYLVGVGDATHAIGKAATVLDKVNRLRIEGVPQIDCCIGIGLVRSHDTDIELDDLVARADAALYEAKTAGKNRYRLYTDTMILSAHGALTPVDDDICEDPVAVPLDLDRLMGKTKGDTADDDSDPGGTDG
ncbi:MAG: EAL domain-containing protein [Atopobiaceae bacterium]|jgi:diguanylate cyclase (GGDEF)-like protein|nr:EAL domain-containing protein [Atopobiaceae bacterium]MCH4277042.1 EAL domain-containing protein [Atopobiaceae bacterium]